MHTSDLEITLEGLRMRVALMFFLAVNVAAQYIPLATNSTELAVRRTVRDGVQYQINYAFDTTLAVVPALGGASAFPHYDAKITVYRLEADGSMVPIYTKHGTFVEQQCWRDGPCVEPCCDGAIALVEEALRPKWKVWYDDGSGLQVFHSARNRWSDIPAKPGVQVVLVCEAKQWAPGKPYRRLMRGSDWYGWRGEELQRDEHSGLPNGKWVSPPPELRSPRRGLTIQDQTFASYVNAAQEDETCSVS